MFALYVTLQVRPQGRADFLAAIEKNARASVSDEPGCLGFDVLELDAAQNRFAFYELYADEDAFQVAHRQAPHFLAWRGVADKVLVPGSQVNTVGTTLVSLREPATAPAPTSSGGSE